MASNKAATPAFAALFDQQEECDVFFQVGKNQIGAHRAFIKARSKVLDRMIKEVQGLQPVWSTSIPQTKQTEQRKGNGSSKLLQPAMEQEKFAFVFDKTSGQDISNHQKLFSFDKTNMQDATEQLKPFDGATQQDPNQQKMIESSNLIGLQEFPKQLEIGKLMTPQQNVAVSEQQTLFGSAKTPHQGPSVQQNAFSIGMTVQKYPSQEQELCSSNLVGPQESSKENEKLITPTVLEQRTLFGSAKTPHQDPSVQQNAFSIGMTVQKYPSQEQELSSSNLIGPQESSKENEKLITPAVLKQQTLFGSAETQQNDPSVQQNAFGFGMTVQEDHSQAQELSSSNLIGPQESSRQTENEKLITPAVLKQQTLFGSAETQQNDPSVQQNAFGFGMTVQEDHSQEQELSSSNLIGPQESSKENEKLITPAVLKQQTLFGSAETQQNDPSVQQNASVFLMTVQKYPSQEQELSSSNLIGPQESSKENEKLITPAVLKQQTLFGSAETQQNDPSVQQNAFGFGMTVQEDHSQAQELSSSNLIGPQESSRQKENEKLITPAVLKQQTLFGSAETQQQDPSVQNNLFSVGRMVQKNSKKQKIIPKKQSPLQKTVVITEMNFKVFRDVLRYIYSDEIYLTNQNVIEILYAAVRFELDHLEGLCAKHLSKSINCENILTFMQIALEFNATALTLTCGNFFGKHSIDICSHPKFCSLSLPVLSALLEVENLELTEISLFRYVKKWMERQCETAKLPKTGSNMRSFISDALYKIRFPTMSVWDFSNEVTTIDGLLTEVEIAQVFRKITTYDNKEVNCQFPYKFRFAGLNSVSRDPIITERIVSAGSQTMSISDAFGNWQWNGYNLDAKLIIMLLQSCTDKMNTPRSNCSKTAEERKECQKLFSQWRNACDIDVMKSHLNSLCAALSREYHDRTRTCFFCNKL